MIDVVGTQGFGAVCGSGVLRAPEVLESSGWGSKTALQEFKCIRTEFFRLFGCHIALMTEIRCGKRGKRVTVNSLVRLRIDRIRSNWLGKLGPRAIFP